MAPKKDSQQDPLTFFSGRYRLRKEGYQSYWHRKLNEQVWAKPPAQGEDMYVVLTRDETTLHLTAREFEKLYKRYRA